MNVMQIFEPAMCCSTGLCGVGVDPELLRISTVLHTLGKNNVHVDRYNLSNTPQEFITNKIVNKFVNENGVDGLPITVINEEIVISGRYPTNEEFVQLLNVPKSYLGLRPGTLRAATINKSGGCSCSGKDGCC